MDRCHMERPFYGSRRMVDWLADEGHRVNRKRVQRLMRTMGLVATYPKRRLSLADRAHRVYPYRLRNLTVSRPNQVWCADITYIPMARGFVYLVAVMDWYSRKVLSWRLSNTMDSHFCARALEEALEDHGIPEIVNTDQGSQFTSEAFIEVLKDKDIQISMDGKGRWLDNVFIERLWRRPHQRRRHHHRAGMGLYRSHEEGERRYHRRQLHPQSRQALGHLHHHRRLHRRRR